MKSLSFVAVVSIVLIGTALSLNAACGKGCYDMGNGVCACDIAPEFGPSVKPSEEKPRRNGIPAWQSGEVKADVGIRASEISTTTAHDYSAERTGR